MLTVYLRFQSNQASVFNLASPPGHLQGKGSHRPGASPGLEGTPYFDHLGLGPPPNHPGNNGRGCAQQAPPLPQLLQNRQVSWVISPSLTSGTFLGVAPDPTWGPLGTTPGDGLVSSVPGELGSDDDRESWRHQQAPGKAASVNAAQEPTSAPVPGGSCSSRVLPGWSSQHCEDPLATFPHRQPPPYSANSSPVCVIILKSPGRSGVTHSPPRAKTGRQEGGGRWGPKRLRECRFPGLPLDTSPQVQTLPRNLHFNTRWFGVSLKLERPGLGFLRSQLPLCSKPMGTRSLQTQGKGKAPCGLSMGRR